MVRQETTQLARIYHRDWYNNLVSTEHAEELDEIHSELNIAQEMHSYDPEMYENIDIDTIMEKAGDSQAEEAEGEEGSDEMEEAKFDEDYDQDS